MYDKYINNTMPDTHLTMYWKSWFLITMAIPEKKQRELDDTLFPRGGEKRAYEMCKDYLEKEWNFQGSIFCLGISKGFLRNL